MIDILNAIEAVRRETGHKTIPAGEGRTVRLERDYDAPIEDVWDALTDPARIGRWFLPISGDYRIGGRFRFEGNAGGEILARTSVEGRRMAVAVLDRGPGIPAEMVEHVKQPFARLDASRTGQAGAGLGLAIAERIAALHGGRLELLAREGGGLEARLVLEAVPDDGVEKS